MSSPQSEPSPGTSPDGDSASTRITGPHTRLGRASLETGGHLLEETLDGFRVGDHENSFWRLVGGLKSIRESAGPEAWAGFVRDCLAHPIRGILHQEPYTRRGFARPRGYPGDAGLIDYLYLHGPAADEEVTSFGRALHPPAVRTAGGYSVRLRRDLAAALIDAAADRTSRPAVLSVACGYLREAGRSVAVREKRVGRFLATDQDPESVRVVADEWSSSGVAARCMSVADLIGAGDSLGRFDLVYALGLYDYLSAAPARMLTGRLFELLAPGGTLFLANFTPGGFEAGYMEAFMRWHLIYRTAEELRAVAALLPPDEVAALDVWTEDAGNIAYMTVVRN